MGDSSGDSTYSHNLTTHEIPYQKHKKDQKPPFLFIIQVTKFQHGLLVWPTYTPMSTSGTNQGHGSVIAVPIPSHLALRIIFAPIKWIIYSSRSGIDGSLILHHHCYWRSRSRWEIACLGPYTGRRVSSPLFSCPKLWRIRSHCDYMMNMKMGNRCT